MVMLFVRNRMEKRPKTNFLSGTYDQPVFAVTFRKNPIFLDDYPAKSPIIPDRPGCLE